ncbi:YhdH/YhfP family quinone oxidoreductase [Psychrobacter sp. JB385]|uniref:YhdH/YhfP family quinone oxidoreductase n=1 Tax=Psychrobacter sp. JB385 TaxID=1434841 RepID=UPI00097F53CE|nr:YhdH/YhfP family quinone oxidoreductase [Psychrobacter sp. JB385]SJN21981.1 Alcohol dehydrogenase [Psychrobacter sp. JB385]
MKAFLVEKVAEREFSSAIQEVPVPECNKNEVIIKTTYSSLNYKDALSSIGNPGVTRKFPHITGIDVAGVVHETTSDIFAVGDKVLVTGYDLGMNTDGGHSEFVKVPTSWVARIPDTITDKEIMTFGTAGLTAALSINELLDNGLKPEDGEILVTGATGGVGSIAVSILKKIGFTVVAVSGKEEQIDYLKQIGASEVILRDTFNENAKKPMMAERYAGVVDTVGGDILANALKYIKYDGVATCCGLTASHELNTNVFPFILRGVRLIGIDSVECKLEKKQAAWDKLASEFKIATLDSITSEIGLEDIKTTYVLMLEGKSVGRYVVKI